MQPTDLSIISLLMAASPVVKLVILILVFASVCSLAIILFKRQTLKRADRQNALFLKGFLGGWSIEESFTKAMDFPMSPVAKVYVEAIREMRKIQELESIEPIDGKIDLIQRTLHKSTTLELASMEDMTSWLATTASAAPFIGLFGTVWGIMNSFQSIGATGNASLAAVAPGISEALIATAIGLAAAIPASIGYNFISTKIREQAQEIEAFKQDLLNLLQKHKVI